MDRMTMVALLRAEPNEDGKVVLSEVVAHGAAEAIDGLCDVLVSLHAYHDVPGKKDPVLVRIFSEGAKVLRAMGLAAELGSQE